MDYTCMNNDNTDTSKVLTNNCAILLDKNTFHLNNLNIQKTNMQIILTSPSIFKKTMRCMRLHLTTHASRFQSWSSGQGAVRHVRGHLTYCG